MSATAVPTTRIRFIRPFTARVINPLTRRFAGWLPGFAILTHVGRTSGRVLPEQDALGAACSALTGAGQ